jgi:regulator of sigma E protease
MTGFLISTVAVVIMLGVMILAHEFGHFLIAKLFGVRVDVFSVGFGPRLWGFRRGPTDYRLSALPLGGYVKMAGDNPSEERAGAPDEFLSKPRWQRFLIALAGPTMNVLLALGVVAGLFMVGQPEPVYIERPADVAGVLQDSPAAQAGIRAGDRLIRVNHARVKTWGDALFELMFTMPTKPVAVTLKRAGKQVTVTAPPAQGPTTQSEFAVLGYPAEPVVVGRVRDGMPAAEAGLKSGDMILAADNRPVLSSFQLADEIQSSEGRPVDLLVRRAGREMHLTVKPSFFDPGDGRKRWAVGIGFEPVSVYQAQSPGEAVWRSYRFNLKLTAQIGYTVVGLVQGKVSLKQLAGPIGIAKQSGEAARRGLGDFLYVLAIISLNLGILNLLPIPILDGGHLLMLTIEGTLRQDLSLAVKERFVQVGLVFLLVIFAIVMYNDVLKLLPNR